MIEVTNESSYKYGSADNHHKFSKYYFGTGGFEHPISMHGIKIFSDGEVVNDCIVIGCATLLNRFRCTSRILGHLLRLADQAFDIK